jgi:hypothetical protein
VSKVVVVMKMMMMMMMAPMAMVVVVVVVIMTMMLDDYDNKACIEDKLILFTYFIRYTNAYILAPIKTQHKPINEYCLTGFQ